MPYLFRLVSLALASFFLLHAVIGLLVTVLGRSAIRLAERIEARRAARFLLAVRLVPAAAAGLVVAALCVPSYLRLEPRGTPEGVGTACLAAALLGLAVWGISLARGGRAIRGSANLEREGAGPALALVGIVRPRVLISRDVLRVLAPDQLAVALRHEDAHRMAHDNFKRLLLLLAPDLIPFVNPWRGLERNWARFAEWAADDVAAGGDANRALALAAALVRVARASPSRCPSPLAASLVGSGADLAARVERLLSQQQRLRHHCRSTACAPGGAGIQPAATSATGCQAHSAGGGKRMPLLAGGGLTLLACAVVGLAFAPGVQGLVHEVLEKLIAP